MARKNRREKRREAMALPDPRPVAVPPSQRSTFRVARAQRELAEALPSVVPNSTRDRAKPAARRSVSPAPLSAAGSGPAPRKPRAAPEKASPRAQLSMDKPRACKSRPDGTKSKSGNGPSRSFVPWCR